MPAQQRSTTRRTVARKAPTDLKPKLKKGEFAFDHNGKWYVLPPSSAGAMKVKGKHLRNAMLDGDTGQIALGFATLEACGATQDAIDALYDKTTEQMMHVLGQWMEAGDGDGASLGESSSSSS